MINFDVFYWMAATAYQGLPDASHGKIHLPDNVNVVPAVYSFTCKFIAVYKMDFQKLAVSASSPDKPRNSMKLKTQMEPETQLRPPLQFKCPLEMEVW